MSAKKIKSENLKSKKNKNITDDELEQINAQKEERIALKKSNTQIMLLGGLFVVMFVAMALYLARYIQSDSTTAINNNYNKRSDILEQSIHKGNIYSSTNDILAQTVDNEDGTYKRVYPYKNMFCHVVGSYDMGKTGLELSQNYTMLGYDETIANVIKTDLSKEKIEGNSIVTTLDTKLTETIYDALGDHKGAVIVSEPSTGKILAMVSKPDYDPNNIKDEWDDINNNDTNGSKLINRATQGLYAPGSTFKIVTALEYLRENDLNTEDYSYNCKGKDSFDGANISCYRNHVHGKVDLYDSLAHSCNCSFANIGVNLSADKFKDTLDLLGFNKNMSIKDFVISKSSFDIDNTSDNEAKVQAAIGQGTTLITPLENLMIVSAIANKGKAMTPYLVDKVITSDNTILSETEPTKYADFMTEEEADIMTEMMTGVCSYGTADELKSLGYETAGKTGSAEFSSSDKSHAWFVGFAPADNPKIAVSIIVEEAGTGSQYAVPIAKKIFSQYIGK